MINSNKLKAKIIENGYNNQTLAPLIDITAYTLGQKIANKTPFNLGEVSELQKLLKLEENEIIEIFFTNEVA